MLLGLVGAAAFSLTATAADVVAAEGVFGFQNEASGQVRNVKGKIKPAAGDLPMPKEGFDKANLKLVRIFPDLGEEGLKYDFESWTWESSNAYTYFLDFEYDDQDPATENQKATMVVDVFPTSTSGQQEILLDTYGYETHYTVNEGETSDPLPTRFSPRVDPDKVKYVISKSGIEYEHAIYDPASATVTFHSGFGHLGFYINADATDKRGPSICDNPLITFDVNQSDVVRWVVVDMAKSDFLNGDYSLENIFIENAANAQIEWGPDKWLFIRQIHDDEHLFTECFNVNVISNDNNIAERTEFLDSDETPWYGFPLINVTEKGKPVVVSAEWKKEGDDENWYVDENTRDHIFVNPPELHLTILPMNPKLSLGDVEYAHTDEGMTVEGMAYWDESLGGRYSDYFRVKEIKPRFTDPFSNRELEEALEWLAKDCDKESEEVGSCPDNYYNPGHKNYKDVLNLSPEEFDALVKRIRKTDGHGLEQDSDDHFFLAPAAEIVDGTYGDIKIGKLVSGVYDLTVETASHNLVPSEQTVEVTVYPTRPTYLGWESRREISWDNELSGSWEFFPGIDNADGAGVQMMVPGFFIDAEYQIGAETGIAAPRRARTEWIDYTKDMLQLPDNATGVSVRLRKNGATSPVYTIALLPNYDTTGIEGIGEAVSAGAEEWYDLSGVRVNADDCQPGVYIVRDSKGNTRKVRK